jgi:hypothetical protein
MMGVRTSTVLSLEVGLNNSLDDCLFERSFTELLDTLDHGVSQVLTVEAGTSNLAVDMGDVAQARLIYIESNLEIEVTFGGALATGAIVDGSGGTYPTGFAGGETLNLVVDNGGLVSCSFDAADQSLAQVINRINSCLALNGQAPVASDSGGELRLASTTTGTGSEIDIQSGTGLAILGHSIGVTNGINSTPGASALQLQRPADASGADAAQDVLAYVLATINTSSVSISNTSLTANARVRLMIAGDLVVAP